MPYKGHKSITVREDIYEKLMGLYKENELKYRKQGVNSFSAFVSRYLWELLEREEQLLQQ